MKQFLLIATTASVALLFLLATTTLVEAFVVIPQHQQHHHATTTTTISTIISHHNLHRQHALNLFDPSLATDVAATAGVTDQFSSSSNLLAFSDQGQNLAGIFFQASLLPYLLFLYFLQFRSNRLNNLGNFGFQFVLLFVLSTIPSGIVTKSTYGLSLANCDWLHGGAETLLTVANVLIVLGLNDAMTNTNPSPSVIQKPRNISLGIAGAFFVALALGPSILGVQGHAPFLLGVGDLPQDYVQQLPWVSHTEPVNALTIPTWAIHYSSVLEYLFAMNLIWKFSETTGNPAWKGLTWGMLPLHASGICACTYHFFYNPSDLQFLVSMQAGLTLLGNITLAIAAFRIAKSNGWTIDEVNPIPKSATNPTGLVADGIAAMPLNVDGSAVKESTQVLAAKLIGATVVLSYLTKYGELGIDIPFTPNPPVALAMVLGIPSITAYQYYSLSQKSGETSDSDGEGFLSFLNFGGKEDGDKPALSMDDIKKYGVAGTVAYVLTELAFWVVAFPVAAFALYKSTGHWPDVINETNDRAAVLAFIFAGANVARAFVPVRFGAALALAPWVDDNILSKFGDGSIGKKNADLDGEIIETTSTTSTTSSLNQYEAPTLESLTGGSVASVSEEDTKKKKNAPFFTATAEKQ